MDSKFSQQTLDGVGKAEAILNIISEFLYFRVVLVHAGSVSHSHNLLEQLKRADFPFI